MNEIKFVPIYKASLTRLRNHQLLKGFLKPSV